MLFKRFEILTRDLESINQDRKIKNVIEWKSSCNYRGEWRKRDPEFMLRYGANYSDEEANFHANLNIWILILSSFLLTPWPVTVQSITVNNFSIRGIRNPVYFFKLNIS